MTLKISCCICIFSSKRFAVIFNQTGSVKFQIFTYDRWRISKTTLPVSLNNTRKNILHRRNEIPHIQNICYIKSVTNFE